MHAAMQVLRIQGLRKRDTVHAWVQELHDEKDQALAEQVMWCMVYGAGVMHCIVQAKLYDMHACM